MQIYAKFLIFPPKLTFSNECRSKICICAKKVVTLHAFLCAISTQRASTKDLNYVQDTVG